MARQTYPDELAVRFLLGQLSEPERSALEERFFKDDAVFEDLEIAEEELIERYLDNRLEAADRASFEQVITTVPRLRERVAFARMLAKKVDASKPAYVEVPDPQPVKPVPVPVPVWRLWAASLFRRPAYQMALAAVLLILVPTGIGLWVTQSRLETERLEAQRRLEEQQRITREREEAERRAKLMIPEQPSPSPVPTVTPSKSVEPKFATFVLFPGGSRSLGNGKKDLLLERDQQKVHLTLTLEDTSYSNYVVQFVGVNTKKAFTKKVPHRPGSNSITVELNAVELPTDDYTVQVDGVTNEGTNETVSNYSFRVRRK